MALPSSGPLNLSGIQTEFGGSNPISLSEYYSGGIYVPTGAYGINGSLPTSGAISLNKFYGSQAALDQIQVTSNVYNSFGSFYKDMGNINNADYRWTTGYIYKTYNFSFPGGSYTQGSRWTTIVSMSGIWSGTASAVYTVNGGGGHTLVNSIYAGNIAGIAVYHIEMDFRNVTSVVVQGYKTAANRTFLLACGVFPGKWSPSFSVPGNTYTTTIQAKSIDLHVGGNPNLDNYPWGFTGMYGPSGGSGYTYVRGSGWWYSCFADLAVINGSASATSYSTSWSLAAGKGGSITFDPRRCQLTWITG